jgi:hypothetical protein
MIPMGDVSVLVDRVQLVSWAPSGQKPPVLDGFKVTRDSFVRSQTRIKTYARCKQYQSRENDTKIYWQYYRLKSWLKPWKITMVADDKTGLSRDEIEGVLSHCRFYRFLIIEVAIDFIFSMGVDQDFVRRHALFGKSRRAPRNDNSVLYWGGRKCDKFVRCYQKRERARDRVEVECHSKLLAKEQISTLDDFDGLPDAIYPKNLRFVDVNWHRLDGHLKRKSHGRALIAGARRRASSLTRLRRYLRRNGIVNFHRFLVPHSINEKIDRALTRWIRHFEDSHEQTQTQIKSSRTEKGGA